MEEKKLTEQESLKIITEMITKVKYDFHESGTSALLWGSTIAICGLVSFSELKWGFQLPFDIWWLTMVAIIPQVIISIREQKNKKFVTHKEEAINAIWMVFALSIFALIFYLNIVPGIEYSLMKEQKPTGARSPVFIPSATSLFILLYALPTLATGLANKFRPMVIGGFLCFLFFILSCFTSTVYDFLLASLAGIFNWLIPGFILHKMYLAKKRSRDV